MTTHEPKERKYYKKQQGEGKKMKTQEKIKK
jgi:hypothetical protein